MKTLAEPTNVATHAAYQRIAYFTTESFQTAGFMHGVFIIENTDVTRLGRIFEDAVLRSVAITKNVLTYVSPISGVACIPDAVGSYTYQTWWNGWPTTRYLFQEAHFAEMKLVRVLENTAQLRAMIDVLSFKKGGYRNGIYDPFLKASDYGLAQLTFVCGEDTRCSKDLLDYATLRNVQIFVRYTERILEDDSKLRVSSTEVALNSVWSKDELTLERVPAPAREGSWVTINWKLP